MSDRRRPSDPEEFSPQPAGRPGRESVRLIRKHAEMIDGVNLSGSQVGDRLDLPPREARLLIAEGWAEAARDVRRHTGQSDQPVASNDAKRPKRRTHHRD